MEEIIIEVDNLSFKYDPNAIKYTLEDINLKVAKGEFIAILGHNGSGKSTLAKLINGQMNPTKGEVRVKGLSTAKEENILEIRKTCGMVFQNPDNQIVATIVEEDVAFGPENLGIKMPQLRERVDKALETVEMTEYKRHSPALLSGGQKQRVAIAGILAMDPDCLLMDEPTAMLDPIGRQEIVNTMLKLNEKGSTIILITHFMEEAILADRVLVFNEGKISMEGKPREVFSEFNQMKKLGLDVPQVTELAFRLNQDGFDIPKDILSVDEMVDVLWK
ncbi:energy-coupling factor transporter ATPase [Lagierella sp.]|uniref:energy-coupling factor transporter ATPase n=1 Tax=Lagierella sp. TaxID=2849657 RepID=UPI0026233AF9|nr:energy-coupling factor transporter ATPase [Lagierella sp.]